VADFMSMKKGSKRAQLEMQAGWRRQAAQASDPQPCSWIVVSGPFDHLGRLGQLWRLDQLDSRRAGVGSDRR
jgi:hypothetical protein